ncbi:MAG: hypothetical protein JXJ19_00310 [Elusimicrobia bacterium]|nr:hypothetical protein [Elusimicrobiota bacterium]
MKKRFLLFGLLAFTPVIPIYAGQFDIGEDIDFEYRYIEREEEELASEFRQRLKLYLNGYLDDGVEIGATLQSSGIMNSTSTVVVYQGAKIENLTPFFESAYIKINRYYGYPFDISVGILPIKWVDGILVNHNQIGLPSLMLEAYAPFKVKLEAFHCRTRDALLDISDIQGYGYRAFREFGPRRLELDWTIEHYISSKIVKRYIYGAYFKQNMHRGLEYSFFGYKMKGKKGPGESGETFDGYALRAYGKFEGVVDPLGRGGAWIDYILGSGDLADDERGFLPILSSVESDMIGDYYGRFREYRLVDGRVSDKVTLSHSIANLSMLRNALYATIRNDLTVFMIRSTYKKHQPSLPIGGSLTFGGVYKYSIIDLEIRYTIFAPEDEYDVYEGVRKTRFISGEVRARF